MTAVFGMLERHGSRIYGEDGGERLERGRTSSVERDASVSWSEWRSLRGARHGFGWRLQPCAPLTPEGSAFASWSLLFASGKPDGCHLRGERSEKFGKVGRVASRDQTRRETIASGSESATQLRRLWLIRPAECSVL